MPKKSLEELLKALLIKQCSFFCDVKVFDENDTKEFIDKTVQEILGLIPKKRKVIQEWDRKPFREMYKEDVGFNKAISEITANFTGTKEKNVSR